MKTHGIFVALILALPIWSGCVSDISNDRRFPTDYVVGATYSLINPVFVEKGNETIFGYSGVTLWDPNDQKPTRMPSLIEYKKEPGNWPSILGIADRGVKIKISKIQLEKDFEIGNLIWVYGNLIGTPWDKEKTQLYFISETHRSNLDHVDIPMVNKSLLEITENP